ncbi:E3 Ubiquitin ligase [Haladaptatus litoreus]|uniref:RING-type E3 ubiquitin transferase n=1 Tax=Haladaptatus litoreus TaxID=553468 RepID=A0A1N6ZF94_9EURY|nr:GIDE domain-containing protein [Haladaptatus litoreus]SIR25489.1 E3 Ubiquitin ligase [Haladaptatus litoreus]
MSLLDYPLALAIFCISSLVGTVMFWYGTKDLRTAYRILTNDPNDVQSLGDGAPVEVEGTAQAESGVLQSPFTGTDCLAYEYEVQEERNSKNGRHWRTIDSGRNHVPFRIEDETASALVDPRGADFRFKSERSIDVRGGNKPPERVREFIAANKDVDSEDRTLDLKLFELKTGKDRKYIEKRLDLGESVHVLGEARYDSMAGSEAGEVNIVIGHGENAPRFLVSDADERGAAWRVAWGGLPYALGGVVLLGIAGFVLVGAL